MTNPTPAVNPSPESIARLAARPDDDPIVMVNLMTFAQPDGRQRYADYARVAGREIAERGGHVIYSGQFLVTDDWDTVALESGVKQTARTGSRDSSAPSPFRQSRY